MNALTMIKAAALQKFSDAPVGRYIAAAHLRPILTGGHVGVVRFRFALRWNDGRPPSKAAPEMKRQTVPQRRA